MKARTVEAWVWPLVYGGSLVASLGLMTRRADADLGHHLIVAGGLLAALGVLLVLLRARMADDPEPPSQR